MEALQRLTRRQVDALQEIQRHSRLEHGASLKVIAAAMRISPPSALGHITPLESEGLVIRFRGKSRLTPKGDRTLEEYRRHHRVAENLFSKLGLPSSAACTAAREVDLAISHRTVERVCEAEGHPATCPHGEPIPPCSSDR